MFTNLFSKHIANCASPSNPDYMEGGPSSLKRRGGLRARSVPTRVGKRSHVMQGVEQAPEDEFGSIARGHNPRPAVMQRSVSASALGRFSGRMEWRDLVISGCVERTESNIGAMEPVLDIRHNCVKSESPTLVHQNRPYNITPMSAEVVVPNEDFVIPLTILDFDCGKQLDFYDQKPLLSVDIPRL